jgi:hypothetical protein
VDYLILILAIFQFVALSIGVLFLRKYLPSYLSKKGENLATKEDIAAITHEVEKVRSEYAERLENIAQQNRLLLEQTKRKHQLSLAALDRRLEAHQQVYSLWQKLLSAVHDEDKIGDVVTECQDWWMENCLYLDAEARPAFKAAYHAALDHRSFLRPPLDAGAAKENWKRITDAGEAIVRGVELPSLGEEEYKPVNSSELEDG